MKRIAVVVMVLAFMAGGSLRAQDVDSAHVIRVRAGTNAAEAYQRVAHQFAVSNYSITGAVPDMALSGVADDEAGIVILVTIDRDGSAYCAAQIVLAGSSGFVFRGTGSTGGGGGVVAAERGTRAGKDAWSRLEKFAAALAAPEASK